jgi:hypothetical protein
MSRTRIAVALVAVLALASSQALRADVRSDQKTKFQLAGALGKVVNFFGGKAARDGVTSTVAIKGGRMLTTTGDNTGQIIDLAEEKIYDLDLKKKSYKVTTFAELRRQMEEARKRAEEEARKEEQEAKKESANEKAEPARQDPNAKQMEVDFDVKNTGAKKDINGFSTTQSIMTITVREKGKTLKESGGMVLTSDMWLTPSIPALKEIADFHMKYAQKLYGPMVEGASPQEMASAMAMYPMMKPALEKMAAEGQKLQGTAVLTTTTMDAVKSAEQVAAEASSGSESQASSGGAAPTSVGGLLGGFGRRMAQKKNNDQAAAAGPKDRATVLTTTSETLKVSTTVSAEEVAVPAGFKESR